MTKQQENTDRQVEVLNFVRGDSTATIATTDNQVVTQETETKKHPSLARAIAYLEAKGYVIDAWYDR